MHTTHMHNTPTSSHVHTCTYPPCTSSHAHTLHAHPSHPHTLILSHAHTLPCTHTPMHTPSHAHTLTLLHDKILEICTANSQWYSLSNEGHVIDTPCCHGNIRQYPHLITIQLLDLITQLMRTERSVLLTVLWLCSTRTCNQNYIWSVAVLRGYHKPPPQQV